MGVTIARVLIGSFGILLLRAGSPRQRPVRPGRPVRAPCCLFLPGVLLIAAVLLERTRYRSLAAERSGDGHGPGGGEPARPDARFQSDRRAVRGPDDGRPDAGLRGRRDGRAAVRARRLIPARACYPRPPDRARVTWRTSRPASPRRHRSACLREDHDRRSTRTRTARRHPRPAAERARPAGPDRATASCRGSSSTRASCTRRATSGTRCWNGSSSWPSSPRTSMSSSRSACPACGARTSRAPSTSPRTG